MLDMGASEGRGSSRAVVVRRDGKVPWWASTGCFLPKKGLHPSLCDGLTGSCPAPAGRGPAERDPRRSPACAAGCASSSSLRWKGLGLNEARFADLDEVYRTFGGGYSLAKIRLDHDGNKHILACLSDLGYVPSHER